MVKSAVEGRSLLDELDAKQVLYYPGQSRGLIPINFNLDPDDRILKGQFLCLAQDPEGCIDFLDETEKRLSIELYHDRD